MASVADSDADVGYLGTSVGRKGSALLTAMPGRALHSVCRFGAPQDRQQRLTGRPANCSEHGQYTQTGTLEVVASSNIDVNAGTALERIDQSIKHVEARARASEWRCARIKTLELANTVSRNFTVFALQRMYRSTSLLH